MTIQIRVLCLRDKINNQLWWHLTRSTWTTATPCSTEQTQPSDVWASTAIYSAPTQRAVRFLKHRFCHSVLLLFKTASSACGRRKQYKKNRKSPQKCKLTNTVTALIPKCAQAEHTLLTAGTVPFPRAALTQLLESTDTHYTAAIPDAK